MNGQPNPDEARKPEPEAIFLLSQNNAKRTVKIKQVSHHAAALLGYVHQELEGLPLQTILGEKTMELLDENLEYEEGAADLDEVLRRISDVRLKHHNGDEIPFAIKIVRDEARDQNQWFKLIAKDERRQISEMSLPRMIREHLAGVQSVDAQTGLLDHHTCGRYLETIQHYCKSHGLEACFAILRIDRHEKNLARYGKQGCDELLEHVAACCKTKFREDDVVCQLSDHTIGLCLLDISHEAARVVLNRLRWFIGAHRISFGGKADFAVGISIVFAPVHHFADGDLLIACEKTAAAMGEEERNILIEWKG